jgi:vacuolar-type H+-ATPase subunit E/Vma4
MDNTSLETAIRSEAEEIISRLRLKGSEEIKSLEDAYAAERDAFQKETLSRTDARIRQETSKLENRSSLNLKKLKLRAIEAFIGRVVEEAVKGIRGNPLYINFLIEAVIDALNAIHLTAEIRMMSDDLVFEKEIREAIVSAHLNRDISFMPDNIIRWGGCIIADPIGGRIFDRTIERIYFRKSLQIRQEFMRVMDAHDHLRS